MESNSDIKSKPFCFGPRRGKYYDVKDIIAKVKPLSEDEIKRFEKLDIIYRTLCAILYNFVPTSGHPGGSISSGRFVSSIIYNALDLDIKDPFRDDSDMLVYAAGHKALGLYAMWALRNEVVRAFDADALPDEKFQMRLEDLLGFRRNPVNTLPLFAKFNAKALDGHPHRQHLMLRSQQVQAELVYRHLSGWLGGYNFQWAWSSGFAAGQYA